jgi:hypothetical protein
MLPLKRKSAKQIKRVAEEIFSMDNAELLRIYDEKD